MDWLTQDCLFEGHLTWLDLTLTLMMRALSYPSFVSDQISGLKISSKNKKSRNSFR